MFMDLKELLEDLTQEDIQVNNWDVINYCKDLGVYPMSFYDVKESIKQYENITTPF